MRIALVASLLSMLAASPAAAQAPICDDFRMALDSVPHTALEQHVGTLEWLADGSEVTGCEARFETDEGTLAGAEIPDFMPDPGTELFQRGWVPVLELMGDGPGSSLHGIRRERTVCVVLHDQPAYLDDDGNIVQSETVTVVIQCRET